MAEILPFSRAGPTPNRIRRERTCEIVIFPGVRVNYEDEPAPPKRPSRNPKRKRTKRPLSV
jgi:hypothetical protein